MSSTSPVNGFMPPVRKLYEMSSSVADSDHTMKSGDSFIAASVSLPSSARYMNLLLFQASHGSMHDCTMASFSFPLSPALGIVAIRTAPKTTDTATSAATITSRLNAGIDSIQRNDIGRPEADRAKSATTVDARIIMKVTPKMPTSDDTCTNAVKGYWEYPQ